MQTFPLPAGVKEQHGSWHFVRNRKWTKLCRVSEGRARLYERLQEIAGSEPGTAWHAIFSYLQHGMAHLALATQKHYRNDGYRMLHHFGHYWLGEVEPTHVAQYLKWCRENQRAVTGNREKAFMSSVWEYAMAEGWVSNNPWRGVRRNKERPSRHHVAHAELTAVLDRAPPALMPVFGTGYITGMRETDLMRLKLDNIQKKEIEWTESKTGKQNSQPITPTLRYLLAAATAHREAAAKRHETAAERWQAKGQADRARAHLAKAAQVRAQPFVFLSHRGLPWSEWGLQSALRRFKAGFQFRRLRAKAQTDEPDKNILGHTGALKERYTTRRKLQVVR